MGKGLSLPFGCYCQLYALTFLLHTFSACEFNNYHTTCIIKSLIMEILACLKVFGDTWNKVYAYNCYYLKFNIVSLFQCITGFKWLKVLTFFPLCINKTPLK
jgi:hypothetical protein